MKKKKMVNFFNKNLMAKGHTKNFMAEVYFSIYDCFLLSTLNDVEISWFLSCYNNGRLTWQIYEEYFEAIKTTVLWNKRDDDAVYLERSLRVITNVLKRIYKGCFAD